MRWELGIKFGHGPDVGCESRTLAGLTPGVLLNSRMRARGVCVGALTAEGQRIADMLLVENAADIETPDGAQRRCAPYHQRADDVADEWRVTAHSGVRARSPTRCPR